MGAAHGREAPVALGLSVHTGWALVLAVQGPPGTARVLARRRLQLYFRKDEGAFYHVAAERPLPEAERLIAAAREDSLRRAGAALREFCAALPAGAQPGAAGIVLGNGRALPGLAAILRAHPLVHTAEGVLYRDAFGGACEALGMALHGTPARELPAAAAAALKIDGAALPGRLAAAGREAGRPWARDEKDAWLAALVALRRRPASRPARRRPAR
jgi:hypothetical protein